MPDYITHQVSGKIAIQKLQNQHQPIADLLIKHEKSFQFGLMGADLLYYNLLPLTFGNKRILYLAKGLHAENSHNIGRHSLDFFEKYNITNNLERVFAYICGFMLHHSVDNHTHPIIKKKSRNLKMHKMIEMNLDILIARNKKIGIETICPRDLFSEKSMCPNVMNLFKHMSKKIDVRRPAQSSLKKAYGIMKIMNIFTLSAGKNVVKKLAQKIVPSFFHEHSESDYYMNLVKEYNLPALVDDGIDDGIEHILDFAYKLNVEKAAEMLLA